MKKTNIGGQAIIEGVMMRGKDSYAVAVRKPDQEIVLDKKKIISYSDKMKLFKLPIFRGMLAFVESMIIGIKVLTYSAEFFEPEDNDPKPSKIDGFLEKVFGDSLDNVIIGFSIFISLLFTIGIFMVIPFFASRTLEGVIKSNLVLNIIEGIIKITLFVTYIALISRLKDIQRVFEYHGAEHKTINCLENGEELNVENVEKHSRIHKRCGTSFLLLVMFISIVVFLFIDIDIKWVRVLTRIVLVPFIAGISYEVIKWAGKSEGTFVKIISYPGMLLQNLTTREPDNKQIEVAIVAVNGVLEDE